MVFPRGNIFLLELVPLEYYSFLPIRLIITFVHIFLIGTLTFNVSLISAILVSYLFYMVVALGELTISNAECLTVEEFRKPSNLVKVYRSIQLLNTITMEIVGKILVFTNVFMTFTPIYANFTLITYWNSINTVAKGFLILVLVSIFSLWAFVLQLGKFLHIRGEIMSISWKRAKWTTQKEAKEMSKFRKSCQMVLLKYEKVFIIRKITQFLYVKAVVKGTFRTILTLTAD